MAKSQRITTNLINIGGKKKPAAASAAVRQVKKPVQKKKKKPHSYSIYIYKVLKELKPHQSITRKGMNIMNMFVDDMFKRIAKDAADLVIRSGRTVLLPIDIKSAVMLNLEGDLAAHAINEGERALRLMKES
jgi:histone H2B